MILGNGKVLFVYFFIFVCLVKKSEVFVCNKYVLVCEIFLEIISWLIMFYEIEKVVFLEKGNLYCYDVINIIIVILINIEEVIIVDGWEK